MKIQGGRRQPQALDANPSTAGAELMGSEEGGGIPGAYRGRPLSHRMRHPGKVGARHRVGERHIYGLPGLLSLPCSQMSPLLLHRGEIREAPTQGHHTQQRWEQLSGLATDWP